MIMVAAIVAVSGGCSDSEFPPDVTVYNRSDTDIRVFAALRNGHSFEVTSGNATAAGSNAIVRSDIFPGPACSSSGDLVVRTAAGVELGRTTGPICPGDDWLVDGQGIRRSPPP
jgi:hypothetical protein